MSRVWKDEHGIYIKTDGSVYRPVVGKWSCYFPNTTDRPEDSKHKEGDNVKTCHLYGTTLARVGDETWHGHGCYFDKPANECWDPK